MSAATDTEVPAGRYRIRRSSRSSTIGTAVALGVVVYAATLPQSADRALVNTLIGVLTYLSLAQMWNLLAGFAGLVSIGQQMFVGIGAYALIVAAEDWGVDPFLALPLAGLLAAVLSVPVAAFAFRLRGGYFAIGTWVIAEIFRLLIGQNETLGAQTGRSITRQSVGSYDREDFFHYRYWAALALAAGATLVVVLVLRSRLGLALRAVRDDEDGARGVGVAVGRAKLLVWVLAAFWTGMTGALIFLHALRVQPNTAFSVVNWTALVIFIAVIGGVGSTSGPIFGVLVYWFLTEQFKESDTWEFIILGSVAAVMAVVAPKGIYGLIQRWRPIQFFPVRRRLEGPGVPHA